MLSSFSQVITLEFNGMCGVKLFIYDVIYNVAVIV
jgi:hypothetical protein